MACSAASLRSEMHKLFILAFPLLPTLEGHSNVRSSPLWYPKSAPQPAPGQGEVMSCAIGAKGKTPWVKLVGIMIPAIDRAATVIEVGALAPRRNVSGMRRRVITTLLLGATTRTYFICVADAGSVLQVIL